MVKVGYTSSGQPVLVDETLEQLVEATEDGIVTLQFIKQLIANYLGHSYEQIVIAVNSTKEKQDGTNDQESQS